ncbi:MAG: membrane protein of unknown function [Methanothrix sp.]|nr:MAG: membrane protein of unknown function [Methanothrix sp.]
MAVSVALYVGVGGFRAVVWTDMIQYILLAGLAAYVAHMALGLSANEGVSLIAASTMLGADWWDIFSMGGILGALVFIVALVPGWVAEQDPWQKVWAARDDRSAKRGLLLGATLLVLIYSFCLLAAIGLSVIYPRPGNEMEAEMLYLRIISDNVPGWLLGLLTIGFAAASMSCTDTFATSGASCLSRDLVQRHLWPTATVKEMLILNRILIVIMVFISALIALNVDSIMDAVIIATVIGTTSYFFPIIGGLYWKRATKWGAMAALVAGGGTQILLVSYEQFWLKAPLDSISPYLVEHGVLVGLSLSALFFVGVSLATRQAEDIRLAPFFPDIAERVFQGDLPRADRTNPDYLKIASDIEEKLAGDRIHLRLTIEYSRAHEEAGHQLLMWKPFIEKLQERHPVWFTPTGSHVAYRLSQADMQACIKMVHGTSRQIWLNSEPRQEEGDRQRDELVIAYLEIGEVLLELGLQASPRT